ncbi:4Fe-4S dicluster domain-containing protein [Thermofilum pendens]|uniref:4Fe-4S ferredoxin, iron-sulfur binding domain protein n=1 Tax=Thermofilum pendens (strain DSM 2475 / Hrk 5) TaxID=368408 RepID=A1S026_THEPD|nr:4Fe-4S dicluster domain-containing protein [Thermofilum pendens]ABL78806.1 4Fe-4S ferredoxin, iron-sulfur binding domain protein [Thermofilum pendens Hrk 5]
MVLQKFPSLSEGYAVLVDLDKCIGCRACQVACKDWNSRQAEKTTFSPTFTNPPDLTANDWKVVFYYEGKSKKALLTPAGEVVFEQVDVVPLPFQCMHCATAPCSRACPVGAIKVTPEGAVVISKEECIGCGFCETACPFRVPRRGSDGKYYKCTFCVDRIQNGRAPACVEACPTGVFTFGKAGDIIEKAKELQSTGKTVFGLNLDSYVGGGVRWIYAGSERRSYAIKEHFADRGKPVATQEGRELLKPLILYGGALGALALAAIGVATWRKSRVEEVKSSSQEEKR